MLTFVSMSFSFKKILSCFFITVIFCVAAKDLLVYTQFKLDQDFIAKVLCINKEKPDLQCEGKCFLMQKLQENHDDDSQDFPTLSDERQTIEGYMTDLPELKSTGLEYASGVNYVPAFSFQSVAFDFFHPPETADAFLI